MLSLFTLSNSVSFYSARLNQSSPRYTVRLSPLGAHTDGARPLEPFATFLIRTRVVLLRVLLFWDPPFFGRGHRQHPRGRSDGLDLRGDDDIRKHVPLIVPRVWLFGPKIVMFSYLLQSRFQVARFGIIFIGP
ncbi:hypothetical protein QQP08_000428 [Theobroma cacao]|nr:hypothetical protein QQP08_000428 [Theobroma cacao]